MSKRAILYLALAIVAVVAVSYGIKYYTDHKDVVSRGDDDTTNQSNNSNMDENGRKQQTVVDSLDKDIKKYSKAKPVSKAKVNAKEADRKGIVLNADNKVLVQTDSSNSSEIKKAMAKWNRALGQNVFLPATDNSRVDLLIQDDETRVPINVFKDAESEDDDKDKSEYIDTAINTNDHRIMILDGISKTSSSKGYGNGTTGVDLQKDIQASLGLAIGIDYTDNVVTDKLDRDEGRKELQNKFNQSQSTESGRQLYNKGLTSNTKDVQSMGTKDNKTYITWTTNRDAIENLPVFANHKDSILSVVDEPTELLLGKDAETQGHLIDEELQKAFDDLIDKDKSSGAYRGVDDHLKDGKKTIAGTDSTMGDNFAEYLDGGGE